MKNPLKITLPLSAWVSLVLIMAIVFFRFVYPPVNILSWDVFGYYLYLPASFIYHDLRLTDISWVNQLIEKYQATATFYQATPLPSGGWVMKYSMGMAILNAPGFFIAHIYSMIAGYNPDGFSLPYQYAWAICGLIYTAIGIWIFRKIALVYFDDKTTTILLVITVLATNYFQLTAFEGFISHNYLFTLYTLIVWFTIKWHQKPAWKYAFGLGLAMGMAVLVRPSELVCIIIPVSWGISSKESFRQKLILIKSNYRHVLILAIGAFIAGLPQLLYWKYSTGHWLYYSYVNAGEGFDFMHPYLLQVLFSFRKGWFVYTPVMVFGLAGFISLFRKNRSLFYCILVYFVVNLYVVSSWTCWWYAGGSYSQRALLSSYVLLAFPFGYLIKQAYLWKKIYRALLLSIISLMLILNLFQAWQWAHGIIDHTRMTKAYYFATFGKTSVTEADRKLLLIERSNEAADVLKNESEYTKREAAYFDFEKRLDDNKRLCRDTVFEGNFSLRMDKQNPYSQALELPFKDITQKDHAWIRAEVMVFPTDIEKSKAWLVITFQHNGENYEYRSKSISNEDLKMKPFTWNRMQMDYLTPEVRSKEDKVKAYFWFEDGAPVYIDNLKFEIFD